MSWYNREFTKIQEEQASLLGSPFSKAGQNSNHIDSALLIITNMNTDEDFEKIREDFLKVEGISEVKRYMTKRIQVLYDNRKVTLNHLVGVLESTGYNYVKRICKNCTSTF